LLDLLVAVVEVVLVAAPVVLLEVVGLLGAEEAGVAVEEGKAAAEINNLLAMYAIIAENQDTLQTTVQIDEYANRCSTGWADGLTGEFVLSCMNQSKQQL
jgi:hypothetical protein